MSATSPKQAQKPRPVRARAVRARSGVRGAGGAGGPQDLILAEVVQGLQPEVLRRLRSMSRGELARLSRTARQSLARELRDVSAQLALASLCLEGLIEAVPGERQVLGEAGPQDAQAPLRVTEPGKLYETARRNRELLVYSGELVTSQRLAETLGVTRQAVQQGREARRLFSLEARGEDYFPSFYADPGLDRKVLEDITRVLGDLPAAEKWAFFTTRRGSLGDLTPLDALRKGKRAQVERAAEAFAER
jgi:hypothetical protein